MRREAIAAPAARAAGVRTPALVVDGNGVYDVWERVDGPPIAASGDGATWREGDGRWRGCTRSIAAKIRAASCAATTSATRGPICTRSRGARERVLLARELMAIVPR